MAGALTPAQALANIKGGARDIANIQALDLENAKQLTKDEAVSVIKVIMNDNTNAAATLPANVADELIKVANAKGTTDALDLNTASGKAAKLIRSKVSNKKSIDLASIVALDATTAIKLSIPEAIAVITALLARILGNGNDMIKELLNKAELPSIKKTVDLKDSLTKLSSDLDSVDDIFNTMLDTLKKVDPENEFAFEFRKQENQKEEAKKNTKSQSIISSSGSVPSALGKSIIGLLMTPLAPIAAIKRGIMNGGTRDSKQTKKHKKHKKIKRKKTKKNKYTDII
jgi:urease gamma subunit